MPHRSRRGCGVRLVGRLHWTRGGPESWLVEPARRTPQSAWCRTPMSFVIVAGQDSMRVDQWQERLGEHLVRTPEAPGVVHLRYEVQHA